MVTTDQALVLHKFNENLLIGRPIFEDVSTWREKTDKSDVEQEVMSHTQVRLGVRKDVVNNVIVFKLICG